MVGLRQRPVTLPDRRGDELAGTAALLRVGGRDVSTRADRAASRPQSPIAIGCGHAAFGQTVPIRLVKFICATPRFHGYARNAVRRFERGEFRRVADRVDHRLRERAEQCLGKDVDAQAGMRAGREVAGRHAVPGDAERGVARAERDRGVSFTTRHWSEVTPPSLHITSSRALAMVVAVLVTFTQTPIAHGVVCSTCTSWRGPLARAKCRPRRCLPTAPPALAELDRTRHPWRGRARYRELRVRARGWCACT